MGFATALIIFALAFFVSREVLPEFSHLVFSGALLFWALVFWPSGRRQQRVRANAGQRLEPEALKQPVASCDESDCEVAETESLAGICQVVDGDDIEISGIRIRLHGIDAPEHDQLAISETGRAVAHGAIVQGKLKDKIDCKNVVVDVLKRDRFGRRIGVVYLAGDKSRSINEWMVLRGFAIAAYSDEFQSAEDWAREKRLGMWGYRITFDPREWRKDIVLRNLNRK